MIPSLNQLASYANAADSHVASRLILAVGVVVAAAFALAFFALLVAPLAVLARFGVLPGAAAAVVVYGGVALIWRRILPYHGLAGRESPDGGRERR